jgi:Uma2 family endonuclease
MVPELTLTKPKPDIADAARYWPPLQGEWTYADYTRLPDNGFRYEIIHGELFMSSAPTPRHQQVSFRLATTLDKYVTKKQFGEIMIAPLDVVIDHIATPVQPDIIFIRQERLDIIGERKINGPPDLVVEVLSPGTEQHDRQKKYTLYATAEVKENWLVDPKSCTIEVHVLRGQAYAPLGTFGPDETIQSELLPDLQLAVAEICQKRE